MALGAHDRARARRRTAAAARAARRFAREVDRRGDAVHGVDERQVQLRLEVVAPLGTRGAAATATPPTGGSAAEDGPEQVAQAADVAEVLGIEREAAGAGPTRAEATATAAGTAEAARHRAQAAHLVVGLALLVVGEDVVGGR